MDASKMKMARGERENGSLGIGLFIFRYVETESIADEG